jgi:hypothetical protein
MKNMQLSAAVVAGLLEDLSHKFMHHHDEICELKLTDKDHYIDVLLVKYIGAGVENEQLPIVRAILTSICDHKGSLWTEDQKQLEFNFPEYQ